MFSQSWSYLPHLLICHTAVVLFPGKLRVKPRTLSEIANAECTTGANVKANAEANHEANAEANIKANTKANTEANTEANAEANAKANTEQSRECCSTLYYNTVYSASLS